MKGLVMASQSMAGHLATAAHHLAKAAHSKKKGKKRKKKGGHKKKGPSGVPAATHATRL
jgi:hypothetical protein